MKLSSRMAVSDPKPPEETTMVSPETKAWPLSALPEVTV